MRALLGAVVLIAGMRIALLLAAPDEGLLRPDSPSYVDPARALLAVGEYRACPECAGLAFRVPAYSTFLAGVFAVLGESPRAVTGVQLALSLGATALLALAIKQRFGPVAAAVVFVILAADVSAAGQAAVVLSESLTSTFMAMALALASDRPQPPWREGALGLAVAAMALARPEYWPVALMAPFLLGSRKNSVRGALVLGLTIWLPLGGWFLRSQALAPVIGFSSFYGDGLGNVASHFLMWRIEALDSGVSPDEATRRIHERYPRGRGLPSPISVVLERPLASARVVAGASARFWFMPDGYGEIVRTLGRPLESPIKDLAAISLVDYLKRWPIERPLVFGLALLNIAQLALIYSGILILTLTPRALVQFAMSRLALGITLTVAVAGGITGESRYRTCALPALAVLSAQGWSGAASRLRARAK